MTDTASAAPSQPVAGQCRFSGSQWSECAIEHVAMVLANPAEWQGYEVRYLYAAPHPVAREPLTDEQITVDGLMMTPNSVLENCATAFEAGVRFAERAHGIGTEKGDSHGTDN